MDSEAPLKSRKEPIMVSQLLTSWKLAIAALILGSCLYMPAAEATPVFTKNYQEAFDTSWSFRGTPFPIWRWQDDDYHADSQNIALWIQNTTPNTFTAILPIPVEVNYDDPVTLIAEYTVFGTSSEGNFLNLFLFTETDAGVLSWGTPPPGPWDFGSIHPINSSILFFTQPDVTFIKGWATVDVRPNETVQIGQFLQAQNSLLIPEPASFSLLLLGAMVLLRRTPIS